MKKGKKIIILLAIIALLGCIIYLSLDGTTKEEKEEKSISLCIGTFISKDEEKPTIIITKDKTKNYKMIYKDENNNVEGTAIANKDKIDVTYKIKELDEETKEEIELDFTTKYYQDKKCDYITFENVKYYKEK